MNLKLDEGTATKIYKIASKEIKEILEQRFGKEFFSESITDRVKNIEDVLRIAGKTMNRVIPWKHKTLSKSQKSQNAKALIELITEVYNEGDILDFDNPNQYKYRPYFIKKGGSWVFYYSGFYISFCYGGFGEFFKNQKLSDDAASKFKSIYFDYLPE